MKNVIIDVLLWLAVHAAMLAIVFLILISASY